MKRATGRALRTPSNSAGWEGYNEEGGGEGVASSEEKRADGDGKMKDQRDQLGHGEGLGHAPSI